MAKNPDALDLVQGLDWSGKRVLITGANAGIGVETARAMAATGAEVFMACRTRSTAEAARDSIAASHPQARLTLLELDLAYLDSVEACAKAYPHDSLDVLICNAGVYGGPFNQTNDTVEWRLSGGRPFATILRWFIENSNPDTGAPDEAHRGQVLVVSRVAQPGEGGACVVGYVDALANPNANEMARNVADTLAADFTCMSDTPVYHGQRGPLAGDPVRAFGQ